ncbi:TPA: zinc ribbon domain-containing protein [Candidatus Bathyarchaeota archaeon]|nr:zinc ribbon domain-containing protein [Candidatus Bathyarchaeota archaeon]HIJ08298.1 zinc ribbon domain-containing protein [Candidatus Bathyarchaeota archaeon]
MPYCPKCGNKVEDNMTFCSRCGAPLKAETPVQPAPAPAPQKAEKEEKGEKQEKQEKGEKHEKGRYGFVGFLIGGLVMIFIGIVAYYDITVGFPSSELVGPAILLIIGIAIVVVGAFYAMKARSRNPQTV